MIGAPIRPLWRRTALAAMVWLMPAPLLVVPSPAVGQPQAAETDPGEDRVHIVFSDDRTERLVAVLDARVRQRGRVPQAVVKLGNRTTRDQQLQYLVAWEDADGFPIATTQTVWEPLFLAGREERAINLIGKHRRAYRLIFTLRSAS